MGFHVPVAQLDRASVSEAEGLGFESQRARIFTIEINKKSFGTTYGAGQLVILFGLLSF